MPARTRPVPDPVPANPAGPVRARPSGLRHEPTARFVALTAVAGSLADWTLFAALVAVVDQRTSGSPWATTAVLLARLLPALAFAPMAARRVDGRPLARLLRGHEAGRVVAVGVLALLAPAGPLPAVAAALVALEFAAAMLAAGRESLVSRHVPSRLHPAVNTATAVASYGLLPVGALVGQLLPATAAILLAATLQGAVLLAYRLAWPVGAPAPAVGTTAARPTPVDAVVVAPARVRTGRGLRPTVLGAAVGLAPVVALFTVAPRLAASWLGDPTATAVPTGLLLGGAVGGIVLANRGVRAEVGLLAATAGFALAAAGAWAPGLALVGLGAGLAYLSLQTRLQGQAQDPSQFAAAFAVLKGATVVGTLAGPALWAASPGPTLLLVVAAGCTAAAAGVTAGVRAPLRALARRLVLAAIVVEQVGVRHDGAAVVVSNHPNAVDGVVAMAADPTLRPIARWQRHPVARAGFWLAECVVTTAGTDRPHVAAFDAAHAHLAGGGRIWLAPEGGAHTGRVLRQPRTGAVRMAAAAGVPVQALGIRHQGDPDGPRLSAWRPWRRPRVVLHWGELVRPTGDVAADVEATMAALARASGMSWRPQVVAVAA